MRKVIISFIASAWVLALISCVSLSSERDRNLTLSGVMISETAFGGVERWYAIDKYNYDADDEVRFQVGYFKENNDVGFILYEDGTIGEKTYFCRQGLDLRWDWSWDGNGYRYSFVIQPDGTGLYYDFSFSNDGKAKPRGIYKTHKF